MKQDVFNLSEDEIEAYILSHYPLAVLLLLSSNPDMVLLPVIKRGDFFLGHVSKRNQLAQFDQQKVTLIFQGPNAYISPLYYADAQGNVPTWNYAALHYVCEMECALHEDDIWSIVKLQSKQQDPNWPVDTFPPLLRREMMHELVGLRFFICSRVVKVKMSQNRAPVERQGIVNCLSHASGSKQQTADFMRLLYGIR